MVGERPSPPSVAFGDISPQGGRLTRFIWRYSQIVRSGDFAKSPFAASYALTTWAQAVNRHFEPTVRIQTERGHRVIDSGPYAVVRHPGYVGAVVMSVGVALALGSLWALVPAALVAVLLIGRTLAEEATLKAELPGYAEYTGRVRYRWTPGVW